MIGWPRRSEHLERGSALLDRLFVLAHSHVYSGHQISGAHKVGLQFKRAQILLHCLFVGI